MTRPRPRRRLDPRSDPLGARRLALTSLDAVLTERKMLDDFALSGPGTQSAPDRARALRLARMTLRQIGRADAVLSRFLTKAPPRRVRLILALGTVEMLGLGAPPHGVVDAMVRLAKGGRKTAHQAGLVNAVLRKVAAEGQAAWDGAGPTRLPVWLRQPLVRAWGRGAVKAMEALFEAEPPLDLTVREGRSPPPGATEIAPGSWRMERDAAGRGAGAVSQLSGYAAGDWWVQDVAAARPVRMLGDVSGQSVLDLCAAPGGKTLQLAAAGARVTALDASAPRMGRLRENLDRTGLWAETVVTDALEWTPPGAGGDAGALFDAVVLDAPCTATGTIRRHPELPHLRDAAEAATQIAALTALQDRLIDRALTLLRPGGRLLYCTCSLLPAEGEQRLAAAVTRHPGLRVERAEPSAIGPADWLHADGYMRLRPDMLADRGGMDGFFAVVLRKPGASS